MPNNYVHRMASLDVGLHSLVIYVLLQVADWNVKSPQSGNCKMLKGGHGRHLLVCPNPCLGNDILYVSSSTLHSHSLMFQLFHGIVTVF